MKITTCTVLAALAVASAAIAPAQAQYPNRPIRLIVPFPAGSANDQVARFVQPQMSQNLGQQIVIENRPGAGGNVGAGAAARLPADGYNLLMGNIAQAISATLYSRLDYDFIKDFAPISLVATGSFMLATHPSLPTRSVKELIAFSRQRPGEINVATSGAAIQLAAKLFQRMAKVKMTEVNYKGTPPAITSMVSGETSVGFPSTSATMVQVRAGKLRGLAVTSEKRSTLAPNVPTIAEAGLPGYNVTSWYGLVAPTGTPNDVIAKLRDALVQALDHPAVKKRFGSTDLAPGATMPEAYGALIRSETERWGKLIREAGMKAN